ncbi:MAG TPA: alpha-glucan family phosphorylase, partial [Acetobacteraceae bacterium]|nr:alpha-glucan family phosphorylase [Acetobacteraceae bacterium]
TVFHLNEGHAAFAVLERARSLSVRLGIGFEEALWASRAGNVFTTHTPVSAGFDLYPAGLLEQYRRVIGGQIAESIAATAVALSGATRETGFNMAYLALRGAYASFGVSALHGAVSRHIFQGLFPRWPEQEVPVAHVTNGVHVPSWESPAADAVFSGNGKDPWQRAPETVRATLAQADDATLWEMRAHSRQHLVLSVRERLHKHLTGRGQAASVVALAENVLDPNVLTLGFARRFTAYKRPNLLLRDRPRLERLLGDSHRPVQLVVAGKAHPADEEGKRMIAEWVAFTAHPDLWHRVVFLEDYDIALAQEMVQGVDVWINTPRRPWEACGTSGMKVLANGGINLSELDGWWAEAYAADLGWAIGTTRQPDDATQDARDAEELYTLLEQVVLPEFYTREAGIPRAWIARVRQSIAALAPRFSATRMVQDYLTQGYLPAAAALRRRLADGAAVAHDLRQWERRLHRGWRHPHIGTPEISREADGWSWALSVYLGEIGPDDIRVELYADATATAPAQTVALTRGTPITGSVGGFFYTGRVATTRPPEDYTPRIVPFHAEARVPAELPLIFWKE